MRLAHLGILAALLVHSPATAQTPNKPSNLTRLLEVEASRFPAKVGLYVKHLVTDEESIIHGGDHFNSASVIKIPVMILAYRLADEKKLDLNARVEIKPGDFRGGSGIFRYHDAGLSPALRDVITQMIITSDNTATDIMIARVGARDKVNEFMKQAGFTSSRLVRTVYELFRKRYEVLDLKYRSMTPEDVFALQSNLAVFTQPRQALIKQINDASAGRKLNDEVNRLYIENEEH